MASASFSVSTQFISPRHSSTSGSALPAGGGGSLRFYQPLRVSAASAAVESPCSTSGNVASQASLYEVLGIQMGATCEEIKAAYRRLARTVHPDVASSGGQEDTSSAADEFMRVHAAYTTLSDPEKRANYDLILFRGRRPSTRVVSSAAGFSGYPRRTWETDQCW